jgi:PAS domain S-box-containing protein
MAQIFPIGVPGAVTIGLIALVLLGSGALVFHRVLLRRRSGEHARRVAEQALLESEARFLTLAHHTTDLIVRFSLDDRILYASPSVREVSGLDPQKLIGRTPREVGMGEPAWRIHARALGRVRQSGQGQQEDFSIEIGGKIRHFNWRLIPETDGRGKLVSILTTARDITDLRRREGDLDFQRRLMQSLAVFQNRLFLLDEPGIVRLTLEFIRRFTPVARAVVLGPRGGVMRYSLVGEVFTSGAIAVEQMEGLLEKRIMDSREPMYLGDLAAAGSLHPSEREVAARDGVESFFAIPIVFEDLCLGLLYAGDASAGGVPQDLRNIMPLLSSISGIALKKAQLYDEARHNETWYRALLENAPDALVIFNFSTCRVLEINESARALFGLAETGPAAHGEGGGSPITGLDRFLAEHYERFVLEAREIFQTRIQGRGGASLPCEVRTVRLPPEPGEIVRLSLVDTSERERLEEERRRQAQGLMQADKLLALGELSAGLAHEITQPLSGIALASQVLLKQAESGAVDPLRLARKLRDIGSYIDRVRHLIDHVRTFARDRRDEKAFDFDLHECVRHAVSLMGTQYENHQVSLEIMLGDAPRRVRGNLYEFEQVLLNLLSNAKYAVEQRAEHAPEGFRRVIRLATGGDGSGHQVEVWDNGTGVPSAVMQRVFEPFFTTKPVNQGTGLGLSVSYGIVKNMGGEIRMESREGEYTRVLISLPAAGPRVGEEAP